ncbi:hypothetical protein P153DRAFT_368322 [Dothidotthia symphoricarpi CBS 119687]|uniref:RNA-binding domain-containing protein n=1 Tax=Dothidotthia symphoricarpi CBS 119687 TaxID=1392245 RepID=A0A6A6A886_9PLEO|nr:uncharacterized protein P153DRAFT_368322 [Dothidotthia symphoricarpi CBS 119687]KAF2127766.1 hypothetical protein P153DRAFT_368322 [Dothidotthia symphoricarpi CBS 119687]
MLLREEDQDAFKRWVLPKLEVISDADAEVLADYVIALVTTKDATADIRRNCLEALSDFLQDHTGAFVDDLLRALTQRNYIPHPSANTATTQAFNSYTAPIPSIVDISTAENVPRTPPLNAPRGPAATRTSATQHRLPDRPTGTSAHFEAPGLHIQTDRGQQSRKRKLNERETSRSREGHDAAHNRPSKQTLRKGSKNARNSQGGMVPQVGFSAFAPMATMSNLPPPPPGVPPFDRSNPMAFMAMAAAFGINIPGLDPSNLPNAQIPAPSGKDRRGRCRDYDTKGFCAFGHMCSFEHVAEDVPEYDPNHASLVQLDQRVPQQRVNNRVPHGDRSRSFNKPTGGRNRAPFSLPGPSYDRSNTTLVVEQIPEESFDVDNVRKFFSQFGGIVDIQMQAYKHLAIIKYEDHDAASRAYNSPKAIFDNRFVKVYWHKPDSLSKGSSSEAQSEDGRNADEEILDMKEIEKRQVAAQKLFEERRRKAEEAAAKAEEIEEQLKKKDAEVSELKRELAAKGSNGTADLDEDFSQDLSTLQAEADALFAQQGADVPTRGRGHGYSRGGYRGRGHATFPPRGRPYAPFRGAYQSRGHASFHGARSGVKRLDNRPRRIAVADVENGSTRDEALRQYLLNVEDCTSIEPHPQHANVLILTFSERYQAEMFLDSARNIPDVGKLELSWMPNDAYVGLTSTSSDPNNPAEASDHDSDVTIGGDDEAEDGEQNVSAADADMDVAEDEDQWL